VSGRQNPAAIPVEEGIRLPQGVVVVSGDGGKDELVRLFVEEEYDDLGTKIARATSTIDLRSRPTPARTQARRRDRDSNRPGSPGHWAPPTLAEVR